MEQEIVGEHVVHELMTSLARCGFEENITDFILNEELFGTILDELVRVVHLLLSWKLVKLRLEISSRPELRPNYQAVILWRVTVDTGVHVTVTASTESGPGKHGWGRWAPGQLVKQLQPKLTFALLGFEPTSFCIPNVVLTTKPQLIISNFKNSYNI